MQNQLKPNTKIYTVAEYQKGSNENQPRHMKTLPTYQKPREQEGNIKRGQHVYCIKPHSTNIKDKEKKTSQAFPNLSFLLKINPQTLFFALTLISALKIFSQPSNAFLTQLF